jgi:hypothetical protein
LKVVQAAFQSAFARHHICGLRRDGHERTGGEARKNDGGSLRSLHGQDSQNNPQVEAKV